MAATSLGSVLAASAIQKSESFSENAFGAKAWNASFGDVGVEPPLPPNIFQILESPRPFQDGK